MYFLCLWYLCNFKWISRLLRSQIRLYIGRDRNRGPYFKKKKNRNEFPYRLSLIHTPPVDAVDGVESYSWALLLCSFGWSEKEKKVEKTFLLLKVWAQQIHINTHTHTHSHTYTHTLTLILTIKHQIKEGERCIRYGGVREGNSFFFLFF